MKTYCTFTFHATDEYKSAKQQLIYASYNDKLKELYIVNNQKYNEVLDFTYHLPYSFLVNGIQKINDLSSLLFIIKKDNELSYKTIEVNAHSLDLYESSEEAALMHLIDLPYIIYK